MAKGGWLVMPDRELRMRLARGVRKNAPEARAYLTGRMPSFVHGSSAEWPDSEAPVFVFHEVSPVRFEEQLNHLKRNDYETLDGDGLLAAMEDRAVQRRGSIVLSFDDATSTFWTYAFPLLRKYRFRAILFVIPGLVPDDPTSYPNLEDLWAGRCTSEELSRRARQQPLCTWRELARMHESGIVDIQSHSLTHSRIFVSREIVDFLHPGFDPYFYGNVNVPVSSADDPESPARALRWGAPVFGFASRLSGRPRFVEDADVVRTVVGHVESQGGTAFFQRSGWRGELRKQYKRWPPEALGRFESPDQTAASMRRELVNPKRILEQRLPGKKVCHFCYPWFEGCDLADQLAAEAGYRSVYCGLDTRNRTAPAPAGTARIHRIGEDYLFRLPGRGRCSIAAVWRHRIQVFANRARVSGWGDARRSPA